MENIKNKVGRPRNPEITRILNLNADTKLPLPKGRIQHGTKILQVNVQRCVKASEFVFGSTPIIGKIKEITVEAKQKAAPQIQVHVIQPENVPAAQAEVQPESHGHEVLA